MGLLSTRASSNRTTSAAYAARSLGLATKDRQARRPVTRTQRKRHRQNVKAGRS